MRNSASTHPSSAHPRGLVCHALAGCLGRHRRDRDGETAQVALEAARIRVGVHPLGERIGVAGRHLHASGSAKLEQGLGSQPPVEVLVQQGLGSLRQAGAVEGDMDAGG